MRAAFGGIKKYVAVRAQAEHLPPSSILAIIHQLDSLTARRYDYYRFFPIRIIEWTLRVSVFKRHQRFVSYHLIIVSAANRDRGLSRMLQRSLSLGLKPTSLPS
jgi:hypothetical protein